MQRPRPSLLAGLVVAVALLGSGCGGELSKSDYQAKVREVGSGVQGDLKAFTDADKPSKKQLQEAEDALHAAADDLGDIDPPAEVRKLHEQLEDVLDETGDLFGEMAPLLEQASADPTKLSKADLADLARVTGKFTKIQERMEKIQEAYADKGYSKLGLEG